MHRFAHQLTLGEDPTDDSPMLGFMINGEFVFRPFFKFDPQTKTWASVNPAKTYGIPLEDAEELAKLNRLVETAAEVALGAGCKAIKDAINSATNDLAYVMFSGAAAMRPFRQAMCEYICGEHRLAEITPA